MSLMKEIAVQQLAARKSQDIVKASILTTLLGEATMIGKNDGNRETTDKEAIKIINKFIDSNNDVINILKKNKISGEELVQEEENRILSDFLPPPVKQLTEDQLRSWYVNDYIKNDSPKTLSAVMSALKKEFEGQYDGKVASVLFKGILS